MALSSRQGFVQKGCSSSDLHRTAIIGSYYFRCCLLRERHMVFMMFHASEFSRWPCSLGLRLKGSFGLIRPYGCTQRRHSELASKHFKLTCSCSRLPFLSCVLTCFDPNLPNPPSRPTLSLRSRTRNLSRQARNFIAAKNVEMKGFSDKALLARSPSNSKLGTCIQGLRACRIWASVP